MTAEDSSGKDRIAKNAGASYAGHLVFIVLGFVMPRMIDAKVGQASLGVWDFSWSVVHYLNITMFGIGSAVNRYVARYRAAQDWSALNGLVSTVIALQVGVGLVVLAASILFYFLIPHYFADQLGAQKDTAAGVVLLLGMSLSVQMMFDAWKGVISGCHRWGLHNAINAGGYAVTALGMITALLLGGDIRDMAAIYLAFSVVVELIRWRAARVVCGELQTGWRLINGGDASRAVRFGLKTTALILPVLVVVQSVSILVVANLGPAALAVLARPLSLALQVTNLMNKYSFVLTPTAGSLQGQNRLDELREFTIESARNGWILAVPPMAFLFALGDKVIIAWMGEGYGDWRLTATLAVGYLMCVSQSPVLRIMVGLNLHGKIAKVGGIVAIAVLLAGVVVAELYGWSLWIASCIIAASAGLSMGVAVLVVGARTLKFSSAVYFGQILKDGLALLIVLLAGLGTLRFTTDLSPLLVIAVGAVFTAIVFFIMQRKDLMKIYRGFRPVKGRGTRATQQTND